MEIAEMPGYAGRFALAFLVLVPAAGEATVQESSPITRRDTYWVGVGLGVGSEDVGGQLNSSYQFGANLISLRAAVTAGPFDDGFNDYALLYGRATRGAGDRHLLAAATASIPPPSSDCRSSFKRSGVPANWWDWGSTALPTSTKHDRSPV